MFKCGYVRDLKLLVRWREQNSECSFDYILIQMWDHLYAGSYCGTCDNKNQPSFPLFEDMDTDYNFIFIW